MGGYNGVLDEIVCRVNERELKDLEKRAARLVLDSLPWWLTVDGSACTGSEAHLHAASRSATLDGGNAKEVCVMRCPDCDGELFNSDDYWAMCYHCEQSVRVGRHGRSPKTWLAIGVVIVLFWVAILVWVVPWIWEQL